VAASEASMSRSSPPTAALDSIADPRHLLETLFEHAPTAFQIFRVDGRSIACNQAFRELFGSEPPPEYNVLEDDIAREHGLIALIERAFSGETVRLPAQWYDPRDLRSVSVTEGRRVAIETTLFPLRDELGRVQHIAHCCKDVTAEQGLRLERAEIAATLNSIGDGVIATDNEAKVVRMNPVAERLTGWSLGDARGRALTEVFRVFNEDSGAAVENPAERVLRDGIVVGLANHTELRDRHNVNRPITDSGAPIRDAEGNICGVVLVFHDKTADAEAERALRESRRRLLHAQRVAGLGFWDWDLAKQRIFVSEEVYRMCGVPIGDGHETPELIARVVHVDDQPRLQAALQGAWSRGQSFDLDVRVARPDGRVRWVNTAADLGRDDQGNPSSMFGTLLDITERKQIEDALRESERRLRLLHDLGEVTRAVIDPEQIMPVALHVLGEHLHASRCAFATVDPDANSFTIPHDYTDGCASSVGRYRLADLSPQAVAAMRSGQTLVIRNLDQELTDRPAGVGFGGIALKAIICCSLIRNGEFRAMMAVHQLAPRDWTLSEIALVEEVVERCWATIEQRAAEARLRQSEVLLRIASQAARIGGWSIELPAFRVHWSDEVCRLHEVPLGTAATFDEMLSFTNLESRADVNARLQACARDGTSFDLELQQTSASGRRLWVRAIGQAERNPAGAIVGIQGALQDITERRKLEEQFRQAQKMEAVGRLAGGVAHDFNNLLSVVLSYSSLILSDLKNNESLRADVEEIRRAGERAAQLTQQLLAFSRQQVLQPRVIDLNQIVTGMEKMLCRLLGDDVRLVLNEAHGVGRTLADPGQLEQVIMNLVVNARDAMPSGGTVTLETANIDFEEPNDLGIAAGRFVVVTVSDTGVGMCAETRARVFEPFFTTKDKAKGTGLGLSTVHGIVTQSGGHVSFQSEPGKGTIFKVFLPRVDVAFERAPLESLLPSASLRGSETILVVEDEDQVRVIVRSILRRNGYDVLEAQNAGEAFLICEQHRERIHLLLTDVIMPRISGRELAERVRLMRPDMKVLYVSGYTEDSIVHQGVLEAGIAFLQKPITPASLLRKVREVLGRS
jgi:PAS domain S-box-containing protein